MKIHNQAEVPVITVDGPTASGKGTVSRMLADELGWHLLDSGALYRIVAVAAEKSGVELESEVEIADLAKNLNVEFNSNSDDGEIQVLLGGEDVTSVIRTETCGNTASKVAAIGPVRAALLATQRAFRKMPGLVADGRDMGTVVFPDAEYKFFITASQEERAKRRYKQLIDKGIGVRLSALFEEIDERDRRDRMRVTAPLKSAADAVEIDTSDITAQQVVNIIMARLSTA